MKLLHKCLLSSPTLLIIRSALGSAYTSTQLANNIHKSLPKAYQGKVEAAREAKYLFKLPFEELMGSLMTHKIMMKNHNKEEEGDKKKKTISLFYTQEEEYENEEFSYRELDETTLNN